MEHVAQTVLQPSQIAEVLALEGLGGGVDEAVKFLRPEIYFGVEFFLLSEGRGAAWAISSLTAAKSEHRRLKRS